MIMRAEAAPPIALPEVHPVRLIQVMAPIVPVGTLLVGALAGDLRAPADPPDPVVPAVRQPVQITDGDN